MEATDVLLIEGHVGRQDLEGDTAVKLGIAGAEYCRHPPNPDGFDELEMSKAAATQPAGKKFFGGRRSGCHPGDDRWGIVAGFRGAVTDLLSLVLGRRRGWVAE
jgi:hypothetical protein